MATTFDEILLNTSYSADASGGAEFATVIIRAGEGGSVAYRNSNREDFISKYSIKFGLLSPDRRKALRKFAILREGMARGFRFLAPDDHEMDNNYVGWLNPATGDVEPKFAGDGTTTGFLLAEYLFDQTNSHLRRIIKPSPFDDLIVNFFSSTTGAFIAQAVFAVGDAVDEETGIITETITTTVHLPAETYVEINYPKGVVRTIPVIPSSVQIRVSGIYHVPVAFSQDWQKFSIDESGISEFRVGLEEILPAELGLV